MQLEALGSHGVQHMASLITVTHKSIRQDVSVQLHTTDKEMESTIRSDSQIGSTQSNRRDSSTNNQRTFQGGVSQFQDDMPKRMTTRGVTPQVF